MEYPRTSLFLISYYLIIITGVYREEGRTEPALLTVPARRNKVSRMNDLGHAFNTASFPPPALVAYANGCAASPSLVAKARAWGLPADVAELSCAVMTKVIANLDKAANLRRGSGYGRTKALEVALEACRPPVSDALRIAMVACPVDGRAMLRLWREVCDVHERGVMLDMLRPIISEERA